MRLSRIAALLMVVAAAAWLAACQPEAGVMPTTAAAASPSAPTAALIHPSASDTPRASATPRAASSTPTPTPTASHTPDATATHTAAPSQTSTRGARVRLLFTGDINPGRCPAHIALARNDFTLPYQIVGPTLREADITVGSLDGTISDHSPPSPCPETMNLIGPARTVEGLLYAGFDDITVATNHAKDCGQFGWNCFNRAFFDTQNNLAAAGIGAVGGGATLAEARAPLIVERHGVRFAFLGVTEVGPETWAGEDSAGTAPLSDEALPGLLEDIAAARALAHVVIMLAQWGVEYADTPTEYQVRWAGQMVEAGAALVIGNRAHVVQPVEVFELGGAQAVTAYALGNFVFDQGRGAHARGQCLRRSLRVKDWWSGGCCRFTFAACTSRIGPMRPKRRRSCGACCPDLLWHQTEAKLGAHKPPST